MKKFGFTLIEVLVVIGVLSVIAVLILTIFSRSLRGNNKAQILSVIKQNGQSVLENIDKTIRGSDNVVCPAEKFSDPKTLVVRSEGIYTRYRFTDDGKIKQDNPVKQPLENSDSPRQETEAELVNRVCTLGSIMSDNSVILTDTNTKTGVLVEDGSFTRNKLDGFSDQMKVKFDLKPGDGAPEAVAGQIDAIHFETTIQLR